MFPQTPDELTCAWLSEALRAAGALDDQRVIEVTASPIGADAGFTSRVVRLELRYDRPGPPRHLVAKFGVTTDDPNQAVLRQAQYQREASFYRELGPRCAALHPVCLFAEHDATSGRGLLLLEDLSDAELGDCARGCTEAQAIAVVETLAALHARWWRSTELTALAWLPRFGGFPEQLERFAARRGSFEQRYHACLSDPARALIDERRLAAALLG